MECAKLGLPSPLPDGEAQGWMLTNPAFLDGQTEEVGIELLELSCGRKKNEKEGLHL